jgi:RimJ/RimL family protein N-acetyltransferase
MGAMQVPTLETDRLTMRAHALADLDDYVAIWSDPRTTLHVGGQSLSAEECWARFLRNIGHWALLGFGYWALVERASGRLAGEAGFANLRRGIDPPFGDAPEIGWVIAPWAHGRGYATEAALAALAWGEDAFPGAQRTVCMIHPDNAPSVRVAAKCGYREHARTSYRGAPAILFERQRS